MAEELRRRAQAMRDMAAKGGTLAKDLITAAETFEDLANKMERAENGAPAHAGGEQPA